jgi:hypothetical protein
MGCAAALAAAALFLGLRVDETSRSPTMPGPRGETVVRRDVAAAAGPRAAAGRTREAAREPANTATLEQRLADAAPEQRDRVLEQWLPELLYDDPSAAAHFLEMQTEPFLREVALRTLALEWAALAPEDAAPWAVSLADSEERDRAVGYVAQELAMADPHAALRLLERRTRSPEPDIATVAVITRWADRDFDAARSWLESQPDGATRREVARRLIFLKAGTDFAAAAALAERMLISP